LRLRLTKTLRVSFAIRSIIKIRLGCRRRQRLKGQDSNVPDLVSDMVRMMLKIGRFIISETEVQQIHYF
jgi:hypothetical protein